MRNDEEWDFFPGLLMGGIIVLALGYWGHKMGEAESKQETICHTRGMEMVKSSVSYGKTSTTYYMCRDKNGVIYALEGK